MFPLFFSGSAVSLSILWILHAIPYSCILRKMGISRKFALVPILAEWRIARVLFASMRSFYQPFLAACIFYGAARYVGGGSIVGVLFWLSAMLIYSIFMIRFLWRLCRSFHKGLLFRFLTLLFPFLFLMILGCGKSQYPGNPVFRQSRAPKFVRLLLNLSVFLITVLEFAVLILFVGFFSIRENPPRALSQYLTDEGIKDASGITDQGKVVRREDVMDRESLEAALSRRSRDYFYPDHSQDESVVVMEYVIATDLESKRGMASVNMAQIRDATSAGDGLTFVVQAGGAERMFTSGMEDGSYGRYLFRGGKTEKVMELDPSLCMAEGESLEDFIRWTKENYPADRYMLVLWDHGGGLSSGYGYDELNERGDGEDFMPCDEIIRAVRSAGVQFDLIGFDTCLMQDFDLAYCLEPFADYFLASEETETGYGWNYTLAFSELAKNPGLGTEEFGTLLIASFDPYNTKLNNGEEDTRSTLSMIDLTLVGPAHEKLDELVSRERDAIRLSPENYANVSIAASGAYTFHGDIQIDLIDYLTRLGKMDYEEKIMTEAENGELIDAVRACVVVRNGNAASGVNGAAICFPVTDISSYTDTHEQLDSLGLEERKAMSDEYFSIMAYQKANAQEDSFLSIFEKDYTEEDWYVSGFEKYDTADTFVDIPLKDTGAGYQIELPEKLWKSIADCRTVAWMRTENGRMYLGSDYIGAEGEDGAHLIAMDGTWPHIGGSLICYNAQPARETEEGTIFSGTARARLNGRVEIELYIESDPVQEEAGQAPNGHIVGYEFVNDPFALVSKGMRQLEAGDTLQFLFDYYDDEGNLLEKAPYGKKVTVLSDRPLEVKDEPLGECEIQFGGVLTDVYQRTFQTELLDIKVE